MTVVLVWLVSRVHFLYSLRQEPFGVDLWLWVKLQASLVALDVLAPHQMGN